MQTRWISIFLSCAVVACSGSDNNPSDGGTPIPTDGSTTGPSASDGGAAPKDSGITPPSSDASSGDDSGAVADAGTDSGPSSGAYPSGPYGVHVGDVIANMSWMGYVDDAADAIATTKPYVPYSLDDARKSGRKYAMLNLAEVSCPGCQKSAGELASDAKSVVDAGGIIVEILMTKGFVAQPSQTDLENWINYYKLPITTVKDPDGKGTATFTALGQREQAYIIDLTTMKIVQIISGDITGIGATSGAKGMAAMHTLLGK